MITLQDLSFSYRKKELFSHLDLSLSSGGICGLLGKNGAGKTTLLKLISGLLFADQGNIRVTGEQPSDRSAGFLQKLFLVPEEFRFPSVSPQQYMRLYAPFYPLFNSKQFLTYLEEFELDAKTNVAQISFGQRKKCLLAFALAANCQVTLLDEPTNGLDIPSKKQFRRALASVLTDDRLFIISTHQVRDLESLIDPVVILDEGHIIFNRSIEEISKRLCIETLSTEPGANDALYSEKTFEGYKAVLKNPGYSENYIDLETLFNTVINSRDKVAAIFEKGSSHAS
ncbi:MAG: ABC transporter ATP-binding protein [Desulfobacteraceae bacterium]|nr:ABC transporter ATP-binding protein [Desulfobacteraceae bacterium]